MTPDRHGSDRVYRKTELNRGGRSGRLRLMNC